ncbi:MAG TPA: PQQ-binding-like beta-propeller repeat protein [Pirellulaceae bacterium]|nr:PQQ-binding-like beta-propeller repeat protein [Pirellulaceae bacterium]
MKRMIAVCFGMLIMYCEVAPAATINVEGGLVVCIGAEALESVSDDWKKPGCVFQCLESSETRVSSLRKQIQAAGCYGKVSVTQFAGERLPYINNLANLVIVDPSAEIPESEVHRVLAPYGVAIVEGKTTTKPYPADMDEWPQYLHGADNNCVARDRVVGPPRHVQWISGPAWTRSHMGAASITSMISAQGRLFTIEDTTTAENPFLPAKWKLIARSAFNGVELWTRDYPEWEQVTVRIKYYHAQMKRRLVAIGDTVYCTPGLTAPVTALDAATGETIREYPESEGTQEFAYHDGRLYLVIGDRMFFDGYGEESSTKQRGKAKRKGNTNQAQAESRATPNTAFRGYGFSISNYNRRTGNAAEPISVIVAIDADGGRELWRTGNIADYVGCTMALKGDKLVYQTAHGVYCLNSESGEKNWAVEKKIPYGTGSSPNTLVLTEETVLSEEGASLYAYSLADGTESWDQPIKTRKGYRSSSDVLVTAGALWMCGARNSPTSYSLETGKPIKAIPQTLSKPMGHDRCFRNYITERFYINSKTGGPDCLDLASDAEYPAPFTRATCSMGVLPCNGLIYAGPYACQCHLSVGLHNFNVYYTDEDSLSTNGQVVEVKRSARLVKGSAFGHSAKETDAPWPTYRQDVRRYAGTAEQVPAAGLQSLWKTQLKNSASSPVIAEGKVFLSDIDAHTLHALNASDGKERWQYIAGGRIDSPPTYYKGLLLFGSRDGWVHCVRASDGVLSWRFKDLPDKQICAFGQLESAWPIHGSVLLKNDTAYFCAGRSSYLDGGLFIYGLNPVTGELLHQRQFYGPYAENGFPAFVEHGNRSQKEIVKGTTADVMSSEANMLYIRHQAFGLDLEDGTAGKHLLSSAGMLESKRHHREYSLVKEDFNNRKTWTTADKTEYPTGDILVSDGTVYYGVYGMPVNRMSYFDPHRAGYALLAKTKSGDSWTNKWGTKIPLTGKAMALAGDVVFVAGAPLVFEADDLAATYEGRCGGVLWAASAADGSKLAEYTLDELPAWDAMAIGYGRLFITNQDGSIECWGAR